MDFEAAERLGIKTVIAGGLPGKVAPISSAGIIFDSISKILEERGYIL